MFGLFIVKETMYGVSIESIFNMVILMDIQYSLDLPTMENLKLDKQEKK